MDEKNQNLDSLLKRRKQLQSIIDSRLKSTKGARQKKTKTKKDEKVYTNSNVEDTSGTEMIKRKRSRKRSSLTNSSIGSNDNSEISNISDTPQSSPIKKNTIKNIKITSAYTKSKDSDSFILVQPGSSGYYSPLIQSNITSQQILADVPMIPAISSQIDAGCTHPQLNDNELLQLIKSQQTDHGVTHLKLDDNKLLRPTISAQNVQDVTPLQLNYDVLPLPTASARNGPGDTHPQQGDDALLQPMVSAYDVPGDAHSQQGDDTLLQPAVSACDVPGDAHPQQGDDALLQPAVSACDVPGDAHPQQGDDALLQPMVSTYDVPGDAHPQQSDDALLQPMVSACDVPGDANPQQSDDALLQPMVSACDVPGDAHPQQGDDALLQPVESACDVPGDAHPQQGDDALLQPMVSAYDVPGDAHPQQGDDALLQPKVSACDIPGDAHPQQGDDALLQPSTSANNIPGDTDLQPQLSDNAQLQRNIPINSETESHEDVKQRRKRRRKPIKKCFLDFLSGSEEEPFSAGSSDNWTINESECSGDSNGKKKRKRRKKRVEQTDEGKSKDIPVKKTKRVNKYKYNKKLRDAGKMYENRKGEIKEAKIMLPNPCITNICKRKCYEINEERRTSINDFFWSLDYQRRKDWIVHCSRRVPIERKRTDSQQSRRNVSYDYYINDGEDHRKVCQKFLLNTLNISQKFLLYTISHSKEDMAQNDKRTRTAPSKFSEAAKNYVKEFINKLPVVPSHYNRKDSNRLYLSSELKNISNLYRIYKQDCQKEEKEIVSERVFRDIFQNDFDNVSFHIPKKDKCVLCTKAENQKELLSDVDKEKLDTHILEKKATYKRFEAHSTLHEFDKETITASFDLQKVLNTPHGESMLLYYARKYAVFNFTVYEDTTQEGYCFTWGESDGKRGSNEIASCLYYYLKAADEKGVKNLLLYCDSCPGQNRNKTVLAALNYFLMVSKNLQVIQINFLLPGHTYMQADSMHAIIEREVNKLIVWSPSQWATFFESARKTPKPYNITVMEPSDFLNWEEVTSKTFSKETLKDIKWRQLRIATFKKRNVNKMEIKYSMRENADTHNIQLFETTKRKKGKGKGKGKRKEPSLDINEGYKDVIELNLQPLYTKNLPISSAKYKDLKRLCENGTIPKRFHKEYLQLPHQSQTIDTLLETDEEDAEDEDLIS